MNHTRTRMALAVLGVAALSLSACAKANDSSGDNSSGPSAPHVALPLVGYTQVPYASVQSGGTLNLAASSDPTSEGNWNYNTSEGNEVDALDIEAPTTGGLVRINADGSWSADPDYATSVKLLSTSPQVVEVKLNPKAVWQDGSPITADDYKATFAALSGKNKAYDLASSAGYDEVKSFDVVSPTDFKVTFSSVYADWPSMFGAPIQAKIANSPQLWNKGYTNKPLPSIGPYVFSKVDNNAKVFTLTPNQRWWGEKPKLKEITFKNLDQATQAQAFVNGEINAVEVDQDADSYDAAIKASNSKIERSGGLTWSNLSMNGTIPGLDDAKVRTAIGMALNRVGMAKVANSPVGAAPETQGSYIYMPGQDGYKDNVDAAMPYSPDKAKALLQSDGYKLTNNVWTKGSTKLSFSIIVPAGVDTNKQRAELIQSSLQAVNIPVKIQTVPSAGYFNDIEGGKYDMATFAWAGTAFPISSSESLWYPKGKPGGDGQNFSFVTDPSLGALWKKANAELNPAKRIALANEIDQKIAKVVGEVPLAPEPQIDVIQSNLANYGPAEFLTLDWTKVGFTGGGSSASSGS
jgi:peptide/nickel transport system substrate-binding protein